MKGLNSLLVKCSLVFLFIKCVRTGTVSDYKSYKDYKIFDIEHGDGSEDFLEAMKQFDEQVLFSRTKNSMQMLIAPHLMPVFQETAAATKLRTKLRVDDYSKIIEIEKHNPSPEKGFSWDAYHDVDVIYEYLTNMSQKYPKWAKLIVGGSTYEGRQIRGLNIRTPSTSVKPVIFIESGIHAREWIAPATTTYFINQLLTSLDPDIVAKREQFDWHIFPTVNPDGYHYSHKTDRYWRKTRSKSPNIPPACYGADPNRNWDYNWRQSDTSYDPCDSTYGGSRPFSEVETRSLAKYIRRLKNLTAYIGFHSDGRALLLPFSDSKNHTDNYDDLVKIGSTSIDYGSKLGVGDRYGGPGTAAEILYAASGGSMDWVRYALGTRLVFTFELRERGDDFHWPPSKIYQQGDEVTQMIVGLLKEARNLGYFKNF